MNTIVFILLGILLPFLGTFLGSGTVFFLKASPKIKTQKCLYGFAAGVMLASLVWSLLIPSFEFSSSPFPTLIGFLLGAGMFILLGEWEKRRENAGPLTKKKLFWAVTFHNIPEGMAVGVALAGALTGTLSFGSALLLSMGIALQNFPEGAIISAPLATTGVSKKNAAGIGILSGAVEPLGAILALLLTSFITWLLPYILSFAAGAMLFVVADELIPALLGKEKEKGLWGLASGFALMMLMDVIF
ncbi:MAG: ZIP family metal transporter [Clostridia bacterium]|nr:ZIP family metal transporter [Clostridia bacterium]